MLRIVTHPRIFENPTPVERAVEFTQSLLSAPNCVTIAPGPRHWEIFTALCMDTDATGNEIPDAYFAALAIESGSEWITTDRGFSRYDALRWRHPLG
jgi:uncharacterized protein